MCNGLAVPSAGPVLLFHSISAQTRLLAYPIEAAVVNPSYQAHLYQFYLAA